MNIEYDIFNHLKATSLEPYDNDDYVDSITYSEQKQIWNSLKEKDKEIERLNNIIDELKNWFKGYHKSQSHLSWYEEDYIEFIEHLEKELKGSDKD